MRILVLNPNSSTAMTDGMAAAVGSISPAAEIAYYTAPAAAPASINDDEDLAVSTAVVLHDARLAESLKQYEGVLVSCFSVHPIAPLIAREYFTVTGIFEASVLTALALTPEGCKWGIITTGKFWEQHLLEGVANVLGQVDTTVKGNRKLAGIYSTRLNASDLHSISPDEVNERLHMAATSLLANGNVACVVMGCAGMTGLEQIIRYAATDLFGPTVSRELYVVDGVKAGVMQLENTIRQRNAFK